MRVRGCKQLMDFLAPMRGCTFGYRGKRPLPKPRLPELKISLPGKALDCPAKLRTGPEARLAACWKRA